MIKILWQVYKIIRWHKKTFKDIGYYDQRKHHCSEMHEWMQAMRDYTKNKTQKNYEHLKEEQADVIISGINLLRFKDAFDSVLKKMKTNYSRTWVEGHHEEK